MTEEQKAEQDWIKQWTDRDLGIDEFLRIYQSALIRETEKRIQDLEDECIDAEYEMEFRLKARIYECKRFLKLIGEVKP